MKERAHDLFDVVLLDVNGTLVPSVPDGRTDAIAMSHFCSLVGQLTSMSVAVGLCSDSPVEQLRTFGRSIGLGRSSWFPVVAENGNVVAVGSELEVIAPFPALPHIRAEVAKTAARCGLRQVGDVTAPEFGGSTPTRQEWAFGANRRASASVFGAPLFIQRVQQSVTEWSARHRVDASVELSPDGAYAAIHPYAHAELGKRRALAQLAAREPTRTLLVGNSPADWVPHVEGVSCAFVADTSIPEHLRDAAWYASQKTDLEGVIDILQRVIRGQLALRNSARS
ncbi:hypothetical protein [Streptomyces sp. NPDC048282]|uniref:hypothetical protein n=1 Tax=Streptomyces sp. NPDC048282 TaxID=3365528 RepID=UPI00371ED4F4